MNQKRKEIVEKREKKRDTNKISFGKSPIH